MASMATATKEDDLVTRYEDVHVKLIDLKIPNITPLKTETEVPSWAVNVNEFLKISGVLHDYLIGSLIHDKKIRQAQHASKSFNAVLLLSKLRGIPYPLLDPDKLTNNTFNNYNATVILDFLTTDVQIQRVYKIRLHNEKNKGVSAAKKPPSKNSADTTGIKQDLIRNCLERIFTHFRISTKDKNKSLSNTEMLDMLNSKVKSLKRKLPDNYFDQTRRLLKRSTQTPEELKILSDISKAMRLDYDVRREMLIKRLDVTIQSFLWSDKVVGQEEDLLNAIDPLIKQLKMPRPIINPKKVFDASPSLREEQELRVTEASLNSTVKSVIIGSVPDRGGRANEMRPSMKDMMPGWSSRRSSGSGNNNNHKSNNNNNKKNSRMVFSGSNRKQSGGNNSKSSRHRSKSPRLSSGNDSNNNNNKNRNRSKSPHQKKGGNSNRSKSNSKTRNRSKSPHERKSGNGNNNKKGNNSKNNSSSKSKKRRGKSPNNKNGSSSSFFRKS